MPSSYTYSLRFEKQFTGEGTNTWGDKLDAMQDRIDDAVAGFVSIALTGDYTLQAANTNSAADEARRAHLKFTGSPSNNVVVTIPSVPKSYKIWNATSKTVTISAAGTTVSIDAGDIADVWCDGANVNTTTFGGLDLKSFIAASALSATGSLPAVTGNAGKFVYTDGSTSFWKAVAIEDFSDYARLILGVQVALAVAL